MKSLPLELARPISLPRINGIIHQLSATHIQKGWENPICLRMYPNTNDPLLEYC